MPPKRIPMSQIQNFRHLDTVTKNLKLTEHTASWSHGISNWLELEVQSAPLSSSKLGRAWSTVGLEVCSWHLLFGKSAMGSILNPTPKPLFFLSLVNLFSSVDTDRSGLAAFARPGQCMNQVRNSKGKLPSDIAETVSFPSYEGRECRQNICCLPFPLCHCITIQ